uniref:Transmembrane protein n=2 Tax=Globisporangium ultimum (strain ATCC 200006 / CBS 805.95 / DAOM BR144) TaxID=431595 RepID=K3WQV2_GLOUD
MSKVAGYQKSFMLKTRNTGTVTKKIKLGHVVHLVRRLCVLAAAIFYVRVLIGSSVQSFASLQGVTSPLTVFRNYSASLITEYVGDGLIRDSKLVASLLGPDGATAPLRNDTMYLESKTTTSFTGCTSVAKFNDKIYDNTMLRNDFLKMVEDVLYRLPFLSDHELILPVVDCSFTPLVINDLTCRRVFYLTRLKSNPAQVYHQLAVALGYPYDAPPAYTLAEHLGETEDAKLELRSIPRDPARDPILIIQTARQRGYYMKSPIAQTNIKSMYWPLDTNPASVMSKWIWHGKTWMRDSWAWVHYIHTMFALNTTFNLLVLFLVMYRNFHLGKIWIGDAFASVSNTLMHRGTLVLISWIINGLWMTTEIVLQYSYALAGLPPVYIYHEFMQADVITIFLCLADSVGYFLKERIDPAFAIIVIELGFLYRVEIGQTMLPPAFEQFSIDRAVSIHESGLVPVTPFFASISPLRLWTASHLPESNLMLIMSSFSAVFTVCFFFAILYVIVRKIYKRCYPENAYSQPSFKLPTKTDRSANDEALSIKRTLTLFEIATGAELQNRFGVIADYDNFVYFKGLKFASADGIYCNGFVIANGKFLLATEDIFTIAVMKLTRIRWRTVYTYEVDGSKLMQTAQVVYPSTLTWTDLLALNVSILA